MKAGIENKDYEGLVIIDGCIIIDDNFAIPGCLQLAALIRLHCCHPGQQAMVGTVQHLCWPRVHIDIINLCKNGKECTIFGKNLKPMSPFEMYKSLSVPF